MQTKPVHTKPVHTKLVHAKLMQTRLMKPKEAEASAPRAQDVLRSRDALGIRLKAHLGARSGVP